jgi:DNA-3-methyladenine glycosylase II
LYRKSDEDLITYLTAIKGVGKWTAEMILMFALNRSNVLPLDDMGIQQAIKQLYQLNSSGKQLQKEITEIAHSWQPYRSLACRHLWKWRDAK